MRKIYLSLLFLLLAAMPAQAMEQNMGGHDMAHDQNAYSDRVYLSGMIAHHEGAVQMSEVLAAPKKQQDPQAAWEADQSRPRKRKSSR
ncbi:MAG: DUF305 domain-containing protein [Desulfovibrio fairfieldensis]